MNKITKEFYDKWNELNLDAIEHDKNDVLWAFIWFQFGAMREGVQK